MLQKSRFLAFGLSLLLCVFAQHVFAQGVAINTDGSNADNSAMLDVKSTNAGILVPRLTLSQRNGISNPATGLMIFQTDNTPGFYYNAGSSASPSWIKLAVPTDNFDDADADVTNELQTLSISGHDITLSDGGGTVTVPDNVNDADAVIGNEFQSLSISGHTVSLSDGGGSVTIPDNNTTYSAGNQLSLSGTTFNVTEGAGSGLDADLLDGHQWSEIIGANGWIDDGTTVRLETSTDNVGLGTSTPQAQLHLTNNLQIGTDGLNSNHVLTTWTENGYETNFFFRETPTHGMGIRYNADENKLYFDRYPNQATPVPAIVIQRDASIVEFEGVLDMQSNQILDLDCDGGSTDAASCGWVNANDDNTTYSAGNQLSLSGTTFNVTEGAGSGLDADLLDGHQWSEITGANGWIDDGTAVRLVTSSDKVGIGTTLPGAKLDIKDHTDTGIMLYLTDDNSSTGETAHKAIQVQTQGNVQSWIATNGDAFFSGDIEVVGAYYDSNSEAGVSGQLLSSTATGTAWTEPWVLSANIASSPDDFGTYTDGSISGDDTESTVSMPFNVTYGGVDYSQVVISINGWVTFGTGSNGSYSNSSLPSSSFAGPTVFAYWDDLESEGDDVRYGTVGTAPNRVFIVDYTAQTLSNDYNVRFQVQIHETSGLINVRYRNEMNPSANGQSATIGFQTAGGASAKAYPISYNGKVLDDNRDDSEGWSVCPVR